MYHVSITRKTRSLDVLAAALQHVGEADAYNPAHRTNHRQQKGSIPFDEVWGIRTASTYALDWADDFHFGFFLFS